METETSYARERHETIIQNTLYLCSEVERWRKRALTAEKQVERLKGELRRRLLGKAA